MLRTRVGSGPIFAEHHITASMAKVRLMDLQETVQVRRAELLPQQLLLVPAVQLAV